MWSLVAPCDLSRRSFFAGTPLPALSAIAVLVVLVSAAAALGHVEETARRMILRGAAVCALVVTAVGWARADGPGSVWRTLGVTVPAPPRTILIAAAIGLALGVHLLVTASRTLGYPVALDPHSRVLAGLAYDLALNVPSAELFLRGALFRRVQRHASFGTALAVSTVASLARYVVDPALPGIPEVILGAVVYVGLLAAANAWLLWWSGSLVPPLVGSLLFFAGYRLLSVE
jgi:hypothetical protein